MQTCHKSTSFGQSGEYDWLRGLKGMCFSTWTLFCHYFVFKWLMGSTMFEEGPVISESTSIGSRKTGCNVILWGNSACPCMSTKSACFCYWQAEFVIKSDNIMEKTILRKKMFFFTFIRMVAKQHRDAATHTETDRVESMPKHWGDY